jgi:hypothetical protein
MRFGQGRNVIPTVSQKSETLRLAFAAGCLWLGLASSLPASPLRLSGQASAWAIGNYGTDWLGQGGIRYLPALTLGGKQGFGADVSANGWVEAGTDFRDSLGSDWKVKPYRLTVRYARPRFDARLGLQKISFGSATLLRPLMWFDRIDPRDPLQLTDGVYGLLGRYFLQNNTNFWAWGLLGNSVTKGLEMFPSVQWTPEFGGRVQVSVPKGEIAATGHYRQSRLETAIPEMTDTCRELRFGLDGKWDLGIGLWFEAVANHIRSAPWPYSSWQKSGTLGADYTFGLGNGLSLLCEHMAMTPVVSFTRPDTTVQFTAVSASYPLGLIDNLRALVYYDWSNKGLYRYLSWQRTLDNWVFNVAAFWNPIHAAGLGGTSAASTASGKGLMVTVVFNH